jgi:putative intracellular protease/amidase
MNNKIYILLAEGFETVEALSAADACKRCKVDYTLVSTTGNLHVTSSHGVEVIAGALMEETNFDDGNVLILPAGSRIHEPRTIRSRRTYPPLLLQQRSLCRSHLRAPYVLAVNGIGKDRKVTLPS